MRKEKLEWKRMVEGKLYNATSKDIFGNTQGACGSRKNSTSAPFSINLDKNDFSTSSFHLQRANPCGLLRLFIANTA